MKDLSIIIVSYNTRQLLKECLESLFKTIPNTFSFEVIVVDNASSDDSEAMVEKEFPQVILHKNEANLGFSKANNIGVGHANGEYVLFLNSDTVVYEETVEKMVMFMKANKDVGAATCKLVMPDGKLDDASHRGFPTPWNAFCHFSGLSKVFPHLKLFSGYNLTWMDMSKTHEIDALAGAFMLVAKVAGDQVNFWDEDFFWYGEDLDFCYRLKEHGWKIMFIPDVSILHYKGASGGLKKTSKHLTSATSATKRAATLARFDAMKIFYKKHYMNKYPTIVTWFVMQGINLKLWFAKHAAV